MMHKVWQTVLDDVLERCAGKLDALFNNGGYGQGGALEDLERKHLIAQFETNLFGWHDLTRRIIPLMRKQGHGKIILNSSLLGYVSLPLRGAYIASKYALEGWADTLRMELNDSGISVILIEPGPIATRFRENSMRIFNNTIQVSRSFHHQNYVKMLARFASATPVPFTLPPAAVVNKLVVALESKHPKTRYRVTFPSHLLWYMKRFISDRMMQYVLTKAKD